MVVTLHVWYIYLHLVDFYGKVVGKYTMHGSLRDGSDPLFNVCFFVEPPRMASRLELGNSSSDKASPEALELDDGACREPLGEIWGDADIPNAQCMVYLHTFTINKNATFHFPDCALTQMLRNQPGFRLLRP